MIVVSDTSPITSLAAISRLDLLRRLYGTVVVPQAVYQELTNPPGQPGGADVQSLSWFTVAVARDRARVAALLDELDLGEAEAIVLTGELSGDLLLMDERLGREVAERLGLKIVGTVGVLLAAKQQGYLAAVQPVLDELIDLARFRVSGALYEAVLKAAGESQP